MRSSETSNFQKRNLRTTESLISNALTTTLKVTFRTILEPEVLMLVVSEEFYRTGRLYTIMIYQEEAVQIRGTMVVLMSMATPLSQEEGEVVVGKMTT